MLILRTDQNLELDAQALVIRRFFPYKESHFQALHCLGPAGGMKLPWERTGTAGNRVSP